MPKLVWDEIGKKLYETGVRQGVLYVQSLLGLYPKGVAWNGLTSISEKPSGAESNPKYADDIKYVDIQSAEQFGGTVEAFMCPDEFAACDGSVELVPGVMIGQQTRKAFGMCYKTAIGNDTEGYDHGYKLHLVYGAKAAPSEKGYSSVNESPDAMTLSYELTTTPVAVTGHKPTSQMIINSTLVDAAKLAALEDILYGTDVADPRLPLPDEVYALFAGEVPAALSMSTIVPADEATNIALDSNVVITFNNKIAAESIIVTSSTGEIVAGTKSLDATGKILTFDPTAGLTNGKSYLVMLVGVTDIYNQSLAPIVKSFATVA